MDFHGITMQGKFISERLDVLPIWTQKDIGRLIYINSTGVGYLGGNDGWIRITIPESLLRGNGSSDGGVTSALSNIVANYLNSGFISFGKTNNDSFIDVGNGICIKKTPSDSEANKFYLYATSKIEEFNTEYVPMVYLLGTILPLVGMQDGDGNWNLPIITTEAPIAGTRQDLIYIEFYKKIVNSNDGYYPWGNVEYQEKTQSQTDWRVAHTIGFTGEGIPFQWCWKIHTAEGALNEQWLDDFTSEALTKCSAYGLNTSPVSGKRFVEMKQINGEEVLYRAGSGQDDINDGLQTADGYVYALPICFIHRRSKEIFSLVTPNGTASESGLGNGSYLKGETFNGRPDKLYYDLITKNDIWDIRFKSIINLDSEKIENQNISAFMTGKLITKWVSDEYGTEGYMMKNNIYQFGEVFTVDGIGRDINNVFGNNAKIGVFLVGENGATMFPDGVRRYWGDVKYDMPVLAYAIQGDDNSEVPSKFFTYEPRSRTVTLNTTALSGKCIVKNETPVMYWFNDANGAYSRVQTSSQWTGLNTTSAACIISQSDHDSHVGQFLLIKCSLTYPEGCGLRYNPSKIVEISDNFGNTFTPIEEVRGFTKIGNIKAATLTQLYLDDAASNIDNTYVGEWIHIINSDTPARGQYRKIIGYVGITRQVTLDSPLQAQPNTGDNYTISPLEPGKLYVVYNSSQRSLTEFVQRKRLTIKANGTAKADNIIKFVSAGSIQNDILVVNAEPGRSIDSIITYSPVDGCSLRIYYTYIPYHQMYSQVPQGAEMKLLHPGRLLLSTYGPSSVKSNKNDIVNRDKIEKHPGASEFNPAVYIPFSEITPIVDGVKHVGKGLAPSTTILDFDTAPQLGDWPYAGMTLRSDGTTDLLLKLRPAIDVEAGSGLAIVFWIVEYNGKMEILFSTKRKATEYFDINEENLFIMHPITRLVFKEK